MNCHAPSCPAPAVYVCKRCGAASYCSQACQRACWPWHKALCSVVVRAKPELRDYACACVHCNVQPVPRLPRGGLLAASADGDVVRVRLLLATQGGAGHDVNAALTHAVRCGHADIVAALCDAGANADGVALVLAVSRHLQATEREPGGVAANLARCVAVASELLRRAAPPSTQALLFACRANARELVALLLAHGADVNGVGERGNTALMTAGENASRPVIELLVAAGADPHARADTGWSALHFAVTNSSSAGSLENLRALIVGGVPINGPSATGSTPLWIASQVRRD